MSLVTLWRSIAVTARSEYNGFLMKKMGWLLLCFLLGACSAGAPEPMPTRAQAAPTLPAPTATRVIIPTLIPTARPTVPAPATTTPVATSTARPAAARCEIVAAEAVTVYQRPDPAAAVFGSLDAAFRPEALVRTPDGAWIGFDPAVAQAANVGVFRLRWVAAAEVDLEGGCADLEVVVPPPTGVCFTMPLAPVPVYVQPEAGAALVGELAPGMYAAVAARTPGGWARLDLEQGQNDLAGSGWARDETLNVNGPCDDLPPAG